MRVGLVLGAGGIQGAAWLSGALAALAKETGWDPASADRIVGTSAGSLAGTSLAAGVAPGEVLDLRPRRPVAAAAGSRSPFPLPGSPRLVLNGLVRPLRQRPGVSLAGWLPQGRRSTAGIQEIVRQLAPRGWDHHAGLRVVACDYASGTRVPFGAPDAPAAPLADAVAASCAIPGVFAPVRIGARSYVDGGAYSASNLDLVAAEGLDLVICLNPTSSKEPLSPRGPGWLLGGIQRASGWRLRREATQVRERGAEVLLIEPTREDAAQMGPDLMSPVGREETVSLAIATTAEQLRRSEAAALLAALASAPR